MAAASQNAKSVVLNSWKEIAMYLGRGVRTVQRYEHELGLPVRRPRAKSRSAVVALTEDLDAWLRRAPTNGNGLVQQTSPAPLLVSTVRQSIGQGEDLRHRCHQLRDAHNQALNSLITSLSVLVDGIHSTTVTKAPPGGRPLIPRV